ncbi:glycosyltransferase [Methyloprofundus sp.]|uniref:glycosyltransferase n=1 Tax=Methyloprofundus sp. TaxID=2020875 RepID=UPI003D10EF8D
MGILFVHDHVFLTQEGNVHSNTFSNNILSRYVDVFSEVTVLARHREVENTQDTRGMPIAGGPGVNFIFLDSISTLHSYFGLRQRYQTYIAELLGSYEAVIVRVPSELGLMTAEIAHRMGKKYIVEVVGCAWDAMWHYGGFQSKVYAPFFYLKMHNAIKKSGHVSYVTEQFLQKRYPAKQTATCISVSDVELPLFDERILAQRYNKIELMSGKLVFGSIANMNVQYKGIDVAIKMLAEAMLDTADFEYHILGAGDPAAYQQLAEKSGIGNKVFFDGTLSTGKAVLNWMDEIDIYLQPSFQEGLPRSVIEAMSRGCPVIGSSVGGIPELLDKHMMFSHKQPKRLIDIIRNLVSNKQGMTEQAKRNFDTARDYQKSRLDEKRSRFWSSFRDESV